MCNANNKYINRALSREQILFNLSKVPNRYNFQHHSAKGGNYKISPQNVRLRVFGFPQKRPVKHHVFLDLFRSGSGTLRVSKSQTCPAPSLLSRVFISGSRVIGNPVAHIDNNTNRSEHKHFFVQCLSYFRIDY